jgi:hypothetical protein
MSDISFSLLEVLLEVSRHDADGEANMDRRKVATSDEAIYGLPAHGEAPSGISGRE